MGSWLQPSAQRAASLMLEKFNQWINALRVQIKGECHDVHVAGALAVAEQRALDALGAGHHRELGGRDGGTAVVVRMDAQHDAVALVRCAGQNHSI